MIEKSIDFNKEARDKLLSGVNKIADAVKSTLGAGGTTVILEDDLGRPHITKDGVTVARYVNLSDPVEHLAAEVVKQASIKTADEAGDGTTTSIVITQAIVNRALDIIDKNPEVNVTTLRKHIQDISNDLCDQLDAKAKPVTEDSLESVATISANNDPELGSIIAEAYNKVGVDGVVTIEESMSSETYVDVVEGTRVKRGFHSPYLITDKEKNQAILDNPLVLVSDKAVNTVEDIEIPLRAAMQAKRPLLIIADVETPVMNTLNVNKARGVLNVNVLAPEGVGLNRFELLEDLGIMTGATVVSDDTGNDWNGITPEFLGEAKKSVSSNKETIITLNLEKTADAVKEQAERVRQIIKNKEDQVNDWHYKDRLSRLGGGIAAIYVGAQTEVEMKEKKDRVDDAVSATKAALEEGILPGGGSALLNLSERLYKKGVRQKKAEAKYAHQIMIEALHSPIETIISNATGDIGSLVDQVYKSGRYSTGYDVKKGRIGNMYTLGIIDPLKVTKNALRNAVSVAITILQTNCVISNKRA
jgi:chaperonin GroEL